MICRVEMVRREKNQDLKLRRKFTLVPDRLAISLISPNLQKWLKK